MLQIVNPIPQSIRDSKELGEFFEKYSIIPYYGTTEGSSHNMLKLLSDITTLAPSHKACKKEIKTWAFGSRVGLIRTPVPGLDEVFNDEVTDGEKIAFNEQFLTRFGISITEAVNTTREIYDNIADSGNGYLRISITTVGGTTKVDFKALHYKHVAYLHTKKSEDKVVVYSKIWGDADYWRKVPPQLYNVSYIGKPFVWTKKGNKLETVLHIKTKNDESDYYGRPDILSVLYWLFVEWSQSDLALKTSTTEFVAKMLLAFEEPDPARTKKGSSETSRPTALRAQLNVLRQLTTNEGSLEDAKTLAAVEYPFGGKPPTSIPLPISRDTAFTKHQIETASSYIYAAHGWDKQLTGFTTARANIGGNVIIDLFTVKNTSVIVPLQDDYTEIWAEVFKAIAEQVNYSGEVLTIKFPNLIEDLVINLQGAKTAATQVQDTVNTDEINNDIQAANATIEALENRLKELENRLLYV